MLNQFKIIKISKWHPKYKEYRKKNKWLKKCNKRRNKQYSQSLAPTMGEQIKNTVGANKFEKFKSQFKLKRQ